MGGYSKDVRTSIKCLIGDRSDSVMKQLQNAMLPFTLNIGRNFKFKFLNTQQFHKKCGNEHLDPYILLGIFL